MWFEELIFGGGLIIALSAVFGGIPYTMWRSAGITARELNRQCDTNYTQQEVFFAGSTLTELCRIKNQKFIIDQK